MARRLPPPRWQTPLPSSVVGSWGPDVEAYAHRELAIVLDRWQRRVLNRALAYDAGGHLVHRIYLASAGRQNGKTVIVRSLVGTALTAATFPDWRMILGLAHDKKQARVPYTAVLADLASIRHKFGRGGLALTRYLGIRSDLWGRHREYDVASREARDAIRTFSVDLGVFDEVRTQRTYDTFAALEPTTRARPDPLIFEISTAGDDRSILLRDQFERGLRIIDGAEPADGFGMTWYAAADELAPDDPRAILQANPAVAEGRIPIGPVAASIRALTPATYRAETLNLWTEGSDEWLPAGTWLRQLGVQPTQAMRVVLGVEATSTWRRATVTIAAVTDVGCWVGVAGEIDSARTASSSVPPTDLVKLVDRLAKVHRPAEIAFSKAWAGSPHIERWAEDSKVRVTGLGPRQIRSASALFRSELIGGRLTHGDDALLAQQVRAGRPNTAIEGGDWYFSVRDSVGEIEGLRAAAWAAWAAISPEERHVTPQVFL